MLKLYGSPLSSPTNKVIYTLNYLDLPYEFHQVNLRIGEHRKAEFLEINPAGRIPALVDDDFKLAESSAIIRYLADKQESAVYPRELLQRALVDQWLDYAVLHIGIPLSKIMFNTYFYKIFDVSVDERSLQDGHTFAEKNLPVLESRLLKSTFIAGDMLTLADLNLLAMLDAAELCEINLASYPKLFTWRDKLQKENFYQAHHENYSVTFNKIMNKVK